MVVQSTNGIRRRVRTAKDIQDWPANEVIERRYLLATAYDCYRMSSRSAADTRFMGPRVKMTRASSVRSALSAMGPHYSGAGLTRLAKALLRLVGENEGAVGGGKLTITQRELSQVIGRSRESTNKQLRVYVSFWAAQFLGRAMQFFG